MSANASVFARWSGTWCFVRHVSGRVAGHGWGLASFTPLLASDDAGALPALHYREAGWWLQPEGTMHRIRGSYDYVYAFDASDSLAVFRRRPHANAPLVPMYTLRVTEVESPLRVRHRLWHARAQHACPCTAAHLAGQVDVYDATYLFREADAFARQVTVRGPEKNYVINTAFARLTPLA